MQKDSNLWLWIVVALLVLVAAGLWWYGYVPGYAPSAQPGQSNVGNQPQPLSGSDKAVDIGKDLNATDFGNPAQDFLGVDANIKQL